MRLSQVFASQVSHKSRSRGYQYFASGAVRDLRISDGAVVATVAGSDDYDVTLEQKDDRLAATCTCPYFTDRLEICKHIWAVILAAEASRLPIVRDQVPDWFYLEAVSIDGAVHEYHFVETISAGKPWSSPLRSVPPSPAAPPRPRREPPAPWRQLFDAVA